MVVLGADENDRPYIEPQWVAAVDRHHSVVGSSMKSRQPSLLTALTRAIWLVSLTSMVDVMGVLTGTHEPTPRGGRVVVAALSTSCSASDPYCALPECLTLIDHVQAAAITYRPLRRPRDRTCVDRFTDARKVARGSLPPTE